MELVLANFRLTWMLLNGVSDQRVAKLRWTVLPVGIVAEHVRNEGGVCGLPLAPAAISWLEVRLLLCHARCL